MNLFFLAKSLEDSTEALCDKHVVKMILETTQLLYTAWHCSESPIPSDEGVYKKTHANHPTAKWVRANKYHYEYTVDYGLVLCFEYTKRYGKTHKCQGHLEKLREWGSPEPTEETFEESACARKYIPDGMAFIPLCMPDEFRGEEGIEAYRQYYKSKQDTIDMRWKTNKPPTWM